MKIKELIPLLNIMTEYYVVGGKSRISKEKLYKTKMLELYADRTISSIKPSDWLAILIVLEQEETE